MVTVIRGAHLGKDPVLLLHGAGHDSAHGVPRHRDVPGAAPSDTPEAAADAAIQLLESHREQAIAEGFETGRKSGYDSGYLSGHEQGMRAGRIEADAALAALRDQLRAEHAARAARWQALIEAAEVKMKSAIDGVEDMLVEIAFEALGKLLGQAMAQRAGVRAAVRNVLCQVPARELLVVRVAPQDLDLLTGDDGLLAGSAAPGVQILADATVRLGGCLLETSGGTLDGRLETQLQALRDTLLRAREQTEDSLASSPTPAASAADLAARPHRPAGQEPSP